MTSDTLSRRQFLKSSGALVVTFSVATPFANRPAHAASAPAPGKSVALDQVDGFVAIDDQGRVTIYSGKVDLGTGVHTALSQIAAEELYVPLDRVDLVQGDTALTPDQGITWGSLTIQAGGMQIRRACATAREALLDRARRSSACQDRACMRKAARCCAPAAAQACRMRSSSGAANSR